MELQVRQNVLILSFLSNRWLQVVLDGKSSQNIQLLLVFLKVPLLVLQLCFSTSMTFLIMLLVILLLMLMILLSTISDQVSDL